MHSAGEAWRLPGNRAPFAPVGFERARVGLNMGQQEAQHAINQEAVAQARHKRTPPLLLLRSPAPGRGTAGSFRAAAP